MMGESSFNLSGALRDVSSWQNEERPNAMMDRRSERLPGSLMGPSMTPSERWLVPEHDEHPPERPDTRASKGTSKVREGLAIVAYPYHSPW